MTDWAGGRERRKPTACKPEDVHLVELDESWKKSHGLSSAVQCRPSDVREKGLSITHSFFDTASFPRRHGHQGFLVRVELRLAGRGSSVYDPTGGASGLAGGVIS